MYRRAVSLCLVPCFALAAAFAGAQAPVAVPVKSKSTRAAEPAIANYFMSRINGNRPHYGHRGTDDNGEQ